MSRNKENIAFQSTTRGDHPAYNLSRTPPSDDFFTDSLLDTSKIPTPSPTRALAGKEPAYRARRAIGNTKTLKAASNLGLKPARTWSPREDRATTRLQQVKPAPIQTTRRSSTLARRPDPTSTPSPPRRTLTDLQSPTSESSPPKGLTDVYQRIADEEDLAAQEGIIGDEEDYTEDSKAMAGVNVNGDRARRDQPRHSQSPSSLPRSSRRSAEVHAGEANKENHRQDDDTGMSDPTGMSFLRDLTNQDLAAKLTPHTIDHAKDRARLERALQRESPIAFSRAYSRQNAGTSVEVPKKDSPVAFSRAYQNSKSLLSSENIQNLYGKVDEEDHTERSSTGSALTERSEPPPNVPRAWGTKSKVGKEWLQKLNDRDGSPADLTSKPPARDSSQIDWTAAAADIPLPSAETDSAPKEFSPDRPRPATLHKQASFDRTKEWDLNDFTGQSLQVSSTPPVRVRANVLDQLRDKEIESLEKRAVTTNRLGEIRKKDSQELLRKLSRSPSVGKMKRDLSGTELSHQKSREFKLEHTGEPIPDTPIVIYRGNSSNKEDVAVENSVEHQPFSYGTSLDTLQKLARATSDSPRPSLATEDWSLVGKAEDSDVLPSVANGDAAKQTLHMDLSRKSSKQVADVEATAQGARGAGYEKTPVVTGAWTDTILPDTVKTVQRQHDSLQYTQTPHVNPGGWIETPMPNGRRQSTAMAPTPTDKTPPSLNNGFEENSSKPASLDEEVSKAEDGRPPEMPKGVLAGLLDKAKRRLTAQDDALLQESNDTLNLGDATIESLEDLALDNMDMTTFTRRGAEFEAPKQMLRKGQSDSTSVDPEFLEQLGPKLNQLLTNIHNASKGISKLEHQVAHAEGSAEQQVGNEATACNACGSLRGGLESLPISTPTRVYLAVPLPRFFHDWQKGEWLPRPTLLGWITLAFSIWYLSESAMCDRYCHPLYAEFYEWPQEPEPRFGYALPTMLWRWSRIREFGPVFFGPLWTLLVAVARILGQMFGLTDGFVDDPPLRSAGLSSSVPFDKSVPTQKWGRDLSMMNDEYI